MRQVEEAVMTLLRKHKQPKPWEVMNKVKSMVHSIVPYAVVRLACGKTLHVRPSSLKDLPNVIEGYRFWVE
jgi:hypothetical protein